MQDCARAQYIETTQSVLRPQHSRAIDDYTPDTVQAQGLPPGDTDGSLSAPLRLDVKHPLHHLRAGLATTCPDCARPLYE